MLLGVDKNSQECFYEADSYYSMMLSEALPEYKMDIWDVQKLRVQAVESGFNSCPSILNLWVNHFSQPENGLCKSTSWGCSGIRK